MNTYYSITLTFGPSLELCSECTCSEGVPTTTGGRAEVVVDVVVVVGAEVVVGGAAITEPNCIIKEKKTNQLEKVYR